MRMDVRYFLDVDLRIMLPESSPFEIAEPAQSVQAAYPKEVAMGTA